MQLGFPVDVDLEIALMRRSQQGIDSQPRIEHQHSDGRHRYANRMFLKNSSDSIQYAHNLMDWYV